MLHNLFALLCLAHLAQGTPTDSCPTLDETSRSVWSILGTCGVTLLICVWHTIHFDVPKKRRHSSLWWKVSCGMGSFFAPELLVMFAAAEWRRAHEKVEQFRRRGYEWSMTHSFFAEMGGFLYCDSTVDEGKLSRIKSIDFLNLCENKKIVNPLIKVGDIEDKSKSDWLGKAILALQLVWFVLQAVVRGSQGLAVTLIELDTVCMGVLSLIIIVLWWYKPLGVAHPYVFYSTGEVKRDDQSSGKPATIQPLSVEEKMALSAAWKPEPSFLDWFTLGRKSADEERDGLLPDRLANSKFSMLVDNYDEDDIMNISLGVTWTVLGGLHLIAWNFEFPTETEKILWRVSSLVLTATPIPFLSFVVLYEQVSSEWANLKATAQAMFSLLGFLGVASRAMLVGLMLASLRALPCSAHENVAWTVYIPHLS